MLRLALAASLCFASDGLIDASAMRQQLVWSLEERLVAATLDELLAGSLLEARSILAAAQKHRSLFPDVTDEELAGAGVLLRAADASRGRLASAGVLQADAQGRLAFVYFGRSPGPELARAYQRYIADVVALNGDARYRAAAAAAARWSDCRGLAGGEASLCRELHEARVRAEVHHVQYKLLVDGGLFERSSGLGASLTRAIAANGAFNSRWGYPE